MRSWKSFKDKHGLSDLVAATVELDDPGLSWSRNCDPGINNLKIDMNRKSSKSDRVKYAELALFAPHFKDKIVMDVGHAEGHILYFMWHHARSVVGCEINKYGQSSKYLNFLRTQENVELPNLCFDRVDEELIKKIEVFWICVGTGLAKPIIEKILACNPTAKIFHLSMEVMHHELEKLGLKVYNGEL
jgi:hypothetical protein